MPGQFLPPAGHHMDEIVAWLEEPAFRAILDLVPAYICIAHDPDVRAMTLNRRARELFGIAACTRVSGADLDRHWEGFEVHDHAGRLLRIADMPIRRAAQGETLREYEFEIRFEDGRSLWLCGDAAPLTDPAGTVTGAVAAFADITQRKLADAHLAEAVADAERARAAADGANADKSRLLAAASHDLRQPIQALELYIEVLNAVVEGRGRDALAGARVCAANLVSQVNDLLDLSKLDAGVIPVNRSLVAVDAVIERVLASQRTLSRAKDLDITVRPSGMRVKSDAALLERVLLNLVSNAIKYTERGGVAIRCRHRNGRVQVVVADSGAGISAADRRRIFEEYYRIAQPGLSQRSSGLGLAIVRRIVGLLGADITVRSKPGCGSVFTLSLPL